MIRTKVDSLRLSIPLRECVVKSEQLTEVVKTIKYIESTGEHINTTTKFSEPIIIEPSQGTYFKVYLDSQFSYLNGQKVTEPYLTLLINSKLLQKDYFKGITKETFKDIYDFVMSTDTFTCSFESFKSGRYNDTDICFDFLSTREDFEHLHKSLKSSFHNPSLLHSVFKSDNMGMWTPSAKNPRTQATPSKPFIKFYSKELDMLYNSSDFAKEHLDTSDYLDLFRFECTISNSKHKKRIGISSLKTFWEFLNTDLQSVAQSVFKEYINKPIIVKSKSMTPSKEVYLNLIRLALNQQVPLSEVRSAFELDAMTHNRVTRNKYKELYHELIKSEEFDLDLTQGNEATLSIYEYLGIVKE